MELFPSFVHALLAVREAGAASDYCIARFRGPCGRAGECL